MQSLVHTAHMLPHRCLQMCGLSVALSSQYLRKALHCTVSIAHSMPSPFPLVSTQSTQWPCWALLMVKSIHGSRSPCAVQFALITGSALLTDKQKLWQDLVRQAGGLKAVRKLQRPQGRLRVRPVL